MARRIVITGASGFVGRHLIGAARTLGWDVLGCVRTPAAAQTVAEAGATPVLVSELTPVTLAPTLAGAQAVVHLAQIGSERAGASYEAVNVAGTQAVAEAARSAGVERAVYLSGLGVASYGKVRYTTNPYFRSKQAAELALFRSLRHVVVLRPSYIVGPGDGLLAALLPALAQGRVEIPGDGAYRCQPIAIRDATAAILAGVELPGPGHRVFDLVGPEPIAYRDLIARVAALAPSAPYTIVNVPLEQALAQARAAGRGDDLDCLLCDEVADPRPLEALLGRFLTPLDVALAQAVRAASKPPRH
jgi:nucleoside-diphosphate-sugar epimerase